MRQKGLGSGGNDGGMGRWREQDSLSKGITEDGGYDVLSICEQWVDMFIVLWL